MSIIKSPGSGSGNDFLNIDYARTLTNMGEWEKATSILKKLKAGGKDYSDADFIRPKYFTGKMILTDLKISLIMYYGKTAAILKHIIYFRKF
ncbi:MAG: hypothetical protein R2942_05275 [Ignavibacteria bacterium]